MERKLIGLSTEAPFAIFKSFKKIVLDFSTLMPYNTLILIENINKGPSHKISGYILGISDKYHS